MVVTAVLILVLVCSVVLSQDMSPSLSQFLVTMDYTDMQWKEITEALHNVWHDAIIPVFGSDQTLDGYLVYLSTSCPDTLAVSNFAAANNRSFFAEQMVADGQTSGILPRIGLVSRGGDCSWSTKINNAQYVTHAFNMSLEGIILFDNQSMVTSWPDNDLLPGQVRLPLVFVNNSIGQHLLRSISLTNYIPQLTSTQKDVFSKVLVYYEVADNATDLDRTDTMSADDVAEAELKVEEETGRWIYTGQWIVNSVAVSVIVGVAAYVYHRLKKRQHTRMAATAFVTADSLSDQTVLESTTSSYRDRVRRQRLGESNGSFSIHEDACGLGQQLLEQHPKLKYDPILIRNSTCAICLDDFVQSTGEKLSAKVVRRLGCGHGFCVPCIDPWLSIKARTCPLCKYDCSFIVLPLPTIHTSMLQRAHDLPTSSMFDPTHVRPTLSRSTTSTMSLSNKQD